MVKQILALQASIPQEALEPIWSDTYRKSWGMKLLMALTAEDLLQVSLSLTSLAPDLSANFLVWCVLGAVARAITF